MRLSPSLVAGELRLLLRSRLAITILTLTLAVSLGLGILDTGNDTSLQNLVRSSYTMAVGIGRYGALLGSLLFSILTIMTLAKDDLKQSKSLILSSSDDLAVIHARITSLILWAFTSVLLTAIGTWIIHLLLRIPWVAPIYLLTLGVVMLGAEICAVLMSSAFCLITANLDLSILLIAASYWLGLSSPYYLLGWNTTHLPLISELAGLKPVAGMVLYSRLFASAISSVLLTLGLLLRRSRGLSLWGSLGFNSHRLGLVVLLIISLLGSAWVYDREPYLFSHDSVFAQELPQDEHLKFVSIGADLILHPEQASLEASVRCVFTKPSEPQTMRLILNAGFEVTSVLVNGAKAKWSRVADSDWVELTLPTGSEVTVELHYGGSPVYPVAMGFPGYIAAESVALLEQAHWLPQPLTAISSKLNAELSITAPQELTVITGGLLQGVIDHGNTKTWDYRAQSNSLNFALMAGRYQQRLIPVDGQMVELFYLANHTPMIEAAKLPDLIKSAVSYYQTSYGAYPYSYPLRIIEASLYKPGGHSSHNLITIAESTFNRDPRSSSAGSTFTRWSDAHLVAHEIAHQWWGSGVDVRDQLPWSSEGLAEYSSIKFIEKTMGLNASRPFTQGWSQSVSSMRNGWTLSSATTKSPWAKGLIEKQARERAKVQAYSEMPLLLTEAEKTIGNDRFISLLASVYQQHCHGSLSFDQFLDEMGLTKEAMLK